MDLENNIVPVIQTDKFEAEQRWFAPLLFWLCLIIACGLFASVFLAPKILTIARLRHDYHDNQVELVAIEKQVQYLERVADAFKNDPKFSEEIARIDFHALEPNTERLSVGETLNPIMQFNLPEKPPQAAEIPWYVPLLERFVRDPDMRNLFLLISALLVIIAFAVLPQPEEPVKGKAAESKDKGWMKRRYKRSGELE